MFSKCICLSAGQNRRGLRCSSVTYFVAICSLVAPPPRQSQKYLARVHGWHWSRTFPPGQIANRPQRSVDGKRRIGCPIPLAPEQLWLLLLVYETPADRKAKNRLSAALAGRPHQCTQTDYGESPSGRFWNCERGHGKIAKSRGGGQSSLSGLNGDTQSD